MVVALFKLDENSIREFQIEGHADANNFGSDLVCAAITGIVNGALNAFDKLFKIDCELSVEENLIKININKNNDKISLLMEMLKIQLQTIEVQFPKNFKIKEVR